MFIPDHSDAYGINVIACHFGHFLTICDPYLLPPGVVFVPFRAGRLACDSTTDFFITYITEVYRHLGRII